VWKLEFTAEAVRRIDALTGKARRQIDTTLGRLADGSRRGKPLRGELKGILSERVGNLRILYREDRGRLTVLVLSVVHRRIAYGGH